MKQLQLRKAAPTDSEFAFQTKKEAFKKYADQVWGWDEEQQRQLHERRFGSQDFFVVQWESVDVGIMAVVKKADCLTINQLFILPEYQGRGIGSSCIEHLTDTLPGSVLTIRLQVLMVNKSALEFFRKMGFREVGTSETHFILEKSVL